MELPDICLTTTYFQFEDKFHQHKEGMALGNYLLCPVIHIFTEHFEKIALDVADHKPAEWLKYLMATWTR
jgi:hypothetical protein